MKKYLQVSTGDLKLVFDKINLLLTGQHLQYDGDVARNRTITPHTARTALYTQLLGRISNYALGKLWDQRFQLTSPDPLLVCTGRFTQSMGLPCAHQIQERLRNNGVLTMEDIHPHWHFTPRLPLTVMPLILEPAVAAVRGRPATQEDHTHARPLNRAARSRQAASSTRREPSSFERVNLPVRARTRSGLRWGREE